MNKKTCDLCPSGFTYTTNEVYDWVRSVVTKIYDKMGRENLVAHAWTYRVDNFPVLAFCVWKKDGADDEYFASSFYPTGEHNFEFYDVNVPDFVEAFHMIGMISESLKLKIEVGQYVNEVNPYCTEEWTSEKQTNAKMKLDF